MYKPNGFGLMNNMLPPHHLNNGMPVYSHNMFPHDILPSQDFRDNTLTNDIFNEFKKNQYTIDGYKKVNNTMDFAKHLIGDHTPIVDSPILDIQRQILTEKGISKKHSPKIMPAETVHRDQLSDYRVYIPPSQSIMNDGSCYIPRGFGVDRYPQTCTVCACNPCFCPCDTCSCVPCVCVCDECNNNICNCSQMVQITTKHMDQPKVTDIMSKSTSANDAIKSQHTDSALTPNLLCKSECPQQKIIFVEGDQTEDKCYNKINVYTKETELSSHDHIVFLEGKQSFRVKLPKLTNNEETGTCRNYRVIKIKGLDRATYELFPSDGDSINSTKKMRLVPGKACTLYGCNNNWITMMT
jgi:hypothetical protein